MNKLLIICGPTATGKTALSVQLAKRFSGEILSADSRQVYKGMDIGTGKDLPPGAKFQISPACRRGRNFKFQINHPLIYGHYLFDGVKVWGLDIVDPKYSFNVADYVTYASAVLKDIWLRGKLPIVIGVTGMYIGSLLTPPETMNIKPNPSLRKNLETLPLTELQAKLRQIDSAKWSSMNDSDRANSRRLVRAIEVADWKRSHALSARANLIPKSVLKLGLTGPFAFLYKRIDKRVDLRLKSGMVNEVKRLLDQGVDIKSQAMSASGYSEVAGAILASRKTGSSFDLEKTAQLWKYAEHHDARKQLTWSKKDKEVTWFDISKSHQRKIFNMVQSWYT